MHVEAVCSVDFLVTGKARLLVTRDGVIVLPVLQSFFALGTEKKSDLFHEGEIHIPYGKMFPISVRTQWEMGKNINQGKLDFRLKCILLGESSEPLMGELHHL